MIFTSGAARARRHLSPRRWTRRRASAAPATRWLRRWPPRKRPDDGVATLFVIGIVATLITATGLIVDGGIKIRAMQRADQAAQEAARAGSQMIQTGPAVRGEGAVLDTARAAGAARAYLSAAQVGGSVSVSPARITVTASTTWRPAFLGAVGVSGGTVTATASAEPVSD